MTQIYYSCSICSGKPEAIDESLESFPSGHSTAAFAGFIFLYLYRNAKLKVFSNHHAAMWKLVATYAPVLGATLIAGTSTIDEDNNWYDVSPSNCYSLTQCTRCSSRYDRSSQVPLSGQSWLSVPIEWSTPACGTSASTIFYQPGIRSARTRHVILDDGFLTLFSLSLTEQANPALVASRQPSSAMQPVGALKRLTVARRSMPRTIYAAHWLASITVSMIVAMDTTEAKPTTLRMT